jgi:hypothetical protein
MTTKTAARERFGWAAARSIVLATGLLVSSFTGQALDLPWNWNDEHVIRDARTLRWNQMQTSRAVLGTGPLAANWAAGVYLSENLLAKVIESQLGTVIRIQGIDKIDDLEVTLRKAQIDFRVDAPEVDLELVASSQKKDVSVVLKAVGLLGYAGTTMKGEVPRNHASFQVVLTSVKPAVNWSNFSVAVPGFMKSLIAGGAMLAIADRLRFDVPLFDAPSLSLGDPPAADRPAEKVHTQDIPIKQGSSEVGMVSLQVVQRNADIVLPLSFGTPVFTPDGVWLLASQKPFLPPAMSEPPGPSAAATLRKQVEAMVGEMAAPDGDVVAFIHQGLIADLVDRLGKLPEEQRTVTAKSVKVTGNLWQDKWRDNIFGKGGVYIRGQNDRFASAVTRLQSISARWVPKDGMALSATVGADFAADLHWHFDPLVSGGFGDDVGVSAKTSATANGSVNVRMATIQGQPAALLVPTLACTLAPLDLKAHTDIKLAAKYGIKMFAEPVPPIPLVTTQPLRLELPTGTVVVDKKKDIKASADWKIPVVDFTFTPTAAQATETGYHVSAKLSSLAEAPAGAATPAGRAADKAQRDAYRKQLVEYARTLPSAKCPDPELRLNIGGIEIGPNNELVKYSADAIKLINNTFSEAKKIIKTPGKAIQDAPRNIHREVKKACRRIWKKC